MSTEINIFLMRFALLIGLILKKAFYLLSHPCALLSHPCDLSAEASWRRWKAGIHLKSNNSMLIFIARLHGHLPSPYAKASERQVAGMTKDGDPILMRSFVFGVAYETLGAI